MKKFNLILLASSVIFFSCEQRKEQNTNPALETLKVPTEQPYADPSTVNANSSIILNIEGMTCEMGCGSVIRKNLYNYGGVAQCSFDFKTNRVSNTVEIKYDSTLIQPKTIVETINAIEEGDFKATVHNTSTKIDESQTEQSQESTIVKVEVIDFQFPSISDLIHSFF